MRLESLKIYMCILTSGSFAAAARRFHITQPAVSMTLAALEEEVGQKLLVRTPGQRAKIEPTQAGEIFAEYVKKALEHHHQMLNELASGQPRDNPFIVATTPAPGAVVTPILIGAFRKTFAYVPFTVKTFSGIEIFRRLRSKEYHIAITGTRPTESDLAFDPFFYDPLEVICPLSFDIQTPITLKKLKSLPLIIRPDSSNVMQLFVRELKKKNTDISEMNVIMQAYGNADVLQAVALGSGVGLVTRSIIASSQYNNSVKIVPVTKFQVDRFLYIVRIKDAPFMPQMKLFWNFALDIDWRKKYFPYDTIGI